MSADVLYISYDGMTDPLGRSQVLPYVTGLAALGHRVRLLSLEKREMFGSDGEAVRRICADAGIDWHPLTYRKRPPILSSFVNFAALKREAVRLHRDQPADFTHCRSDLAGMAGLALKRGFDVPLLYDMRAFWPDERAEGGAWNQSKALYRALFRYFKARQRELIAKADEIVVLADEGRKALLELGPEPDAQVTVIPCCADFDHFAPSADSRTRRRAELDVAGAAPLLIHVGSIGCNVLHAEMLDFFAAYRGRYPSARMLFLAPGPSQSVAAAARERGLEGLVQVRSATRERVPDWLSAADLGIFFIRPVPSKRAASPTKLAEMLAMGLPVVTNSGVGDVDSIIAELGAGVIVSSFDPAAYRDAIERLSRLNVDPQGLREAARSRFDVNTGIARYAEIYRRLTSRKTSTSRGA